MLIEKLPAAHVGCTVICTGGTSAGPAHPPPPPGAAPVIVLVGSATVFINKRPAARWAPSGDLSACGSLLGDVRQTPQRTVLVGGPSSPASMPLSIGTDGALQVGNSIKVEGSDGFKAIVAYRLQVIGSTVTGTTVLDAIESSGKAMKIVEYGKDNSFASPDDFQAATPAGTPVFYGDGSPAVDASGKQLLGTGQGSDVTVKLNPSLTLPNKKDPTKPMPNDAVLFHEMNHGNHQMNGSYDGTPKKGWTTEEEHNTIDGGAPSEADYLKERKYGWKRNSHGTSFVPNP